MSPVRSQAIIESMLTYCLFDSWEKMYWNMNTNTTIFFKKMNLKMPHARWDPFFSHLQYVNWCLANRPDPKCLMTPGWLLGISKINTLMPRSKLPPFCRLHSQFTFLVWKLLNFNWNLRFFPAIQIKQQSILGNLSPVKIMAWRRAGVKPLSESMISCFNDGYMRHLAKMSWWVTI